MKILKIFKAITTTREFPVNITDEHRHFFNKLLIFKIAKVKVIQISNVSVIAKGIIFKKLKILKGMSLGNDSGIINPYSRINLFKILLFWPRVTLKKNVQYLVIENPYSHTYYHWLTEALPRLFLIKEKILNTILLLSDTHNQRFHQETLSVFNVQRVEFLKQRIRYKVPDLIVSTQIGKIANYNPLIINDMVSYIKSIITPTLNYGERIYVSRSHASKRKLLNEVLVEAYLKNLGFKIVYFEDHSFAEQVSIMHFCKCLVGVHGAGLANMIFMGGGSIMELRKYDGGENYFYFSLASTIHLNYYYQFCDSAHTSSVQDADIIVNFEEFKENIQRILYED